VPLLIVPNAWDGHTIGNNILIGWNGSRAARRAISDSMAFLVAATSVTVLVVDSIERPEHGEEPGADIALNLARHGACVHVAGMASNHAPIAQVMFAEAVHNGSDLLVIGAYSHASWKGASIRRNDTNFTDGNARSGSGIKIIGPLVHGAR
jgi:hypothetical protein